MKNVSIWATLILIFLNVSFFDAQKTLFTGENLRLIQDNVKKIRLEVKEMTCQKGCADGIDKKLKTVYGVIRSSTKFETGISIVTFDETKISPEEIIKIIEKHGYPAAIAKE